MTDRIRYFCKLTSKKNIIPFRLIEATALTVIFGIFFHLLTDVPGIPWRLAVGIALLTSILISFHLWERKTQERSSNIWAVVSAFAMGLWLFIFLGYLGLVKWPLAHAVNLREYVFLLLSHLVFVATVFACLLWIAGKKISFELVTWGNWHKGLLGHKGQVILTITSIGTWIWAIYSVMTIKLPVSERLVWFTIIAFIKAVLTGATEEVSYRGIIQPVAIDRFGVLLGITVQSCLYAAFHLHLGTGFYCPTDFLMAVMGLGLLFGIITHLTGGVGWACAIHIAINLAVEWRNLS